MGSGPETDSVINCRKGLEEEKESSSGTNFLTTQLVLFYSEERDNERERKKGKMNEQLRRENKSEIRR